MSKEKDSSVDFSHPLEAAVYPWKEVLSQVLPEKVLLRSEAGRHLLKPVEFSGSLTEEKLIMIFFFFHKGKESFSLSERA